MHIQTVFGLLAILAATLSLLIPETRNVDMMATMEQAEEFYRKEMKLAECLIGQYTKPNKEEESILMRKRIGSDEANDRTSNDAWKLIVNSSDNHLHESGLRKISKIV